MRAPILLQEYCISRAQFDFVLDVTKFKGRHTVFDDPLQSVEPKVKAAFTRCLTRAIPSLWSPL